MNADRDNATMDEPIYGHMLIVSIGGVVDGPSFDRIMEAAIESSAWFSVSDQRISDIAIDGAPGRLREYAVDEVDERGLLELVIAAPTREPKRSVESVCRGLAIPYERRLEALDTRLEDEIERWLPGMDAPVRQTPGEPIHIPPLQTRF